MTHRLPFFLAAVCFAAAPLSALAAPPKAKPDAPKAKPDASKPESDAPDQKDAPSKPRAMTPVSVPTGAKAMTVVFGDGSGHFVAARPKGGLDSSGKSADAATPFQIVDLNGGALQDGDKVQIAMPGAGRPSFWQETKGKVTRTGNRPDAACVFVVKWTKKNTSLTLQTAGKKFVSAPANGGALVTTAKATDPSAVFTLVPKK